jgi:hypothetical protein
MAIKAKRSGRFRGRNVLVVLGAIVLGILVTGCSPGGGGSAASEASHLMSQYSWLIPLGLPFVRDLVAQFGSNIIELLGAAAAALAG